MVNMWHVQKFGHPTKRVLSNPTVKAGDRDQSPTDAGFLMSMPILISDIK